MSSSAFAAIAAIHKGLKALKEGLFRYKRWKIIRAWGERNEKNSDS